MNNIKSYAILTVLSVLIVGIHGGLLKDVFGTLQNTTHDVATGVGNMLSFGKDVVLGNRKPDINQIVEKKKAIIGGFIDNVHKTVHDVHQGIRNVLLGEDKNNTKEITIEESPQPNNSEGDINTDGTGLIDIRMASENLARNLDEDMARTTKRFHQGIDELNNNAVKNRNYIEKVAKEAMDKEKELMKDAKKIEGDVIMFRD